MGRFWGAREDGSAARRQQAQAAAPVFWATALWRTAAQDAYGLLLLPRDLAALHVAYARDLAAELAAAFDEGFRNGLGRASADVGEARSPPGLKTPELLGTMAAHACRASAAAAAKDASRYLVRGETETLSQRLLHEALAFGAGFCGAWRASPLVVAGGIFRREIAAEAVAACWEWEQDAVLAWSEGVHLARHAVGSFLFRVTLWAQLLPWSLEFYRGWSQRHGHHE